MTKRRVRWKRGLAVAALCAGMALSGCASQKAGSDAPELPAKHWLEDVPGVPVENKGKLEAVIPNLYDPAKKFSFEDCVFLTIQQSPLLVNSAVELEIKRLALTDAVWKYLPEPRMTVEVGNTLTYYNADRDDVPSNYGKVVPRIGFYARFPNPVESYFNHQAQKIMVNLAISTHRKAVGEAIYKVAQAYLRLEAKNEILRIQKEVAPLARETTRYWEQLESADGRQGVALNLAQQHEREVELTSERMTMEEVMERTSLKILAGVEPQQRLNIDSNPCENVIRPLCLGRRNWLFAGSGGGGVPMAVLAGLAATCGENGVDFGEWLPDVLPRPDTHPAARIGEPLPHEWRSRRNAPAEPAD